MELTCRLANYQNGNDADAIRQLMQHYAQDPMGGGVPLSSTVVAQLPQALSEVPGAFTVLGMVGELPVGLINCLQGFSTFQCKPLINIHDVVVTSSCRGNGVAQRLLQLVEQTALQRGCCKVTLEVLEGNHGARRAYEKFGFSAYQLNPEYGSALFFEKTIG